MAYATKADFCLIFKSDMNRFYLLSLLLTADDAMAESCFVQGFEDAATDSRVFKDWAQSWARRTVIQNAIRTLQPRATASNVSTRQSSSNAAFPPALSAILRLPAFERFAFVITVLEGYSNRECALLLRSTGDEVLAARNRALEQIGSSAEFCHEPARIDSRARAERQNTEEAIAQEPAVHLAVSA